ncbi:MAG: hypothetical protein HYT85_12150 [candidate division NC10 bacterium]|nr:hypothetical protein [candidate division NC10 bacterium]MBI2454675.1 hypothetical protein [candidate division NC10 bacterium]MBI2562804.1 hypothetical protein [candidate division NC10 bacterium]MBI3122525.1 hypothetical protein [candidate division NC10 bacterium]
MRCSPVHGARVLTLALALVLLSSCGASVLRSPTPPGPGVPRIANLRFEPDVIKAGETTQMSFYFEVGSADIQEAFIVERGISQFQFYQSLQAIPVDLREYAGQVAGTVEVPLRWSAEGVRFLELYVVTKKGNTSNRLRAPLTVR